MMMSDANVSAGAIAETAAQYILRRLALEFLDQWTAIPTSTWPTLVGESFEFPDISERCLFSSALCAVCRQFASNIAENLEGGFLYGVYRPGE